MLWFVKKKTNIFHIWCSMSSINNISWNAPEFFLMGRMKWGYEFVLRWARWAPLIPFPTLRILADRNWEWFLMEPKHHLCFVSVIGQTPRAIILWQHHGWFLRQPTPHIKLFPHIKPPKLKGSNTKLMAVLYCLLIPQTKHPHFQNSNNDQLISSVFHYQISHHHFFLGRALDSQTKIPHWHSEVSKTHHGKSNVKKPTGSTWLAHILHTFTTKSQRSI